MTVTLHVLTGGQQQPAFNRGRHSYLCRCPDCRVTNTRPAPCKCADPITYQDDDTRQLRCVCGHHVTDQVAQAA